MTLNVPACGYLGRVNHFCGLVFSVWFLDGSWDKRWQQDKHRGKKKKNKIEGIFYKLHWKCKKYFEVFIAMTMQSYSQSQVKEKVGCSEL